ncbi:hypothetical protein [Sulfurimonas sp.]|uniref:hypothetical protein n=1 Tax=Sulfurimonas sp. TaxID=2022749 RepID=UPI0035651428
MKKLLISIVLLLSIVVVAQQFTGNDYSLAKEQVDKGNYKEFYSEIKKGLEKNDEDAKEILIEYFLKAVDNEDVEKVTFYLEQNRMIINSADKDGSRAIDLILIEENKINIEFVKLLLTYSPDLNYEVLIGQEKFTFPEKASLHCSAVKNGAEVIKLLLDAGMNPNLLTDIQNGYSKYPPLYTSYRYNNFEVFENLLKQTSDINPIVITAKHEDTLTQLMMNEYLKVIEKSGAKLEHPSTDLLYKARRSLKYRYVHNKNMRYFTAMINAGLINRTSKKELKNVFVYLASTGEVDATELFVSNGICKKYKDLCELAAHAAGQENFYQVKNIIKKGK